MNFKKILPIAGIGLVAFLLLGKSSGSTNEPSVSSDGGFTPFTMDTASDSGMATNGAGYNINFEAPSFGQSILPSGNALDSTDTKKSAQTPASYTTQKTSLTGIQSILVDGKITGYDTGKQSVPLNSKLGKEITKKEQVVSTLLGKNPAVSTNNYFKVI